MKKTYLCGLAAFSALMLALTGCGGNGNETLPEEGGETDPDTPGGTITLPERTGESGITYQLLVYSFADSDGDGCGDFKGIESKLDYLKEMGVQAIWLSPIHPASSYHGYDVTDYTTVNPDYGTEADFNSLLSTAHSKGIKIYLDYVLNHSSVNHPWFLEAKSDKSSPYRDYYIFSDDPQADIREGKIPMIATEGASGYDSGQWFTSVSGGEAMKVKFTLTLGSNRQPQTLTIEKVDEISNSESQNSGIYLWHGDPGQNTQFYTEGSSCTLSLEIDSPWGVLIRTSTTSWDNGTKYGAPSGSNQLEWGKPLTLSNSNNADIILPDMSTEMYHSHFWTASFADLDYGSAATCETSPAFIEVTEAADKWIEMGVDGFRLDAVKHIYHNASSDENPTFLGKFYDHCNATYKANGGEGDIYMVAEHFSAASEVAPYYKTFPAFFEFSFWWTLKDAINGSNGSGFVSTIQGYQKLYAQYNSDYIEATKLSNHDEDRAGNDLGRNQSKMKLAGAVLLTCSGEPYIYQGEELGYYGTKSNGDEYVRTPIKWTASGDIADGKLGGKVDESMLTSSISVESQEASETSVLSVYRKFGDLRDRYPSLAKGSLDYSTLGSSSQGICAWYRTYGSERILVVHNFSANPANMTAGSEDLSKMIASNGSVTVSGSKLNIGGYSTALFLQ